MSDVQKQQGDVNIWQASAIPERAEALETNIVREGEATGHMHEIVGSDFQLYGHDGRMLAEIRSEDCRVVHPEHGSIKLEPGIWEFGETYEYDYEAEESGKVVD